MLRSVTLACIKRPNEAGDVYFLSGADSTSHWLWRNLAADLTYELETAHLFVAFSVVTACLSRG